jgi:toxin FitB
VILLDTSVISALMQATPEASVIAWLDRQSPDDVWTTAVSVFEVRFGLSLLADSRRRRVMENAFEVVLEQDLRGRIADFDRLAAEAAASLAARRRQAGRTVDFRDTQIAGIALARRASIATRNVRHFQHLEAPILDPWAI